MVGNNGDYYLNVTTGNIFEKINGVWTNIGNIASICSYQSTKVRATNLATSQSLTSTPSKIILSHLEFDVLNEFSITNYRFTANNAGYYLVTGCLGLSATSTVNLYLYIYKNGAEHSQIQGYYPLPNLTITDILYLNVGDYVELWASSGSKQSTIAGQTNIWMSISRLL
jgi:hypothetical protein